MSTQPNIRPATVAKPAAPPRGHPMRDDWVVVTGSTYERGPRPGDRFWLDEDLLLGDRAVTLFVVSESGGSAGGKTYPLVRFQGVPEVGGAGEGLTLRYRYASRDSAPSSRVRRTVTILG